MLPVKLSFNNKNSFGISCLLEFQTYNMIFPFHEYQMNLSFEYDKVMWHLSCHMYTLDYAQSHHLNMGEITKSQ